MLGRKSLVTVLSKGGSAPKDPRAVDRAVCFSPSGPEAGEPFEFHLNIEKSELRHHGEPLDIRPQAIRLLAILLRHAGQLVTTEELRRELWGNQRLTWRNSLHQCVKDLRRAIQDDASNPRLVATVPLLGYRFVGEITAVADIGVVAPSFTKSRRRNLFLVFAAGFATAVLLPISFLLYCSAMAG